MTIHQSLTLAAALLLAACGAPESGHDNDFLLAEERRVNVDTFRNLAPPTDFGYWATTEPLDGHVLRFRASVAEPADCSMSHVINTMEPEPGLTFAYNIKLDGRTAFFGGGTDGGNVVRLQLQPADIDESVESEPFGRSATLVIHSFTVDRDIEFLGLASGLVRIDDFGFAPGHSFAWRLACSKPLEYDVAQGNQTLIRDFQELDGNGVQSIAASAALVEASIDLSGGSEAGYIVRYASTAEAGRVQVTHPGGNDVQLLVPVVQPFGQFDAETEPGPHALTIEQVAAGTQFLFVGLYAFDPQLQLQPGRLQRDVIRE